jgi:ketosteroid isomerase-like protein
MSHTILRRIVILFVAAPLFAIALAAFAGDEKIPGKESDESARAAAMKVDEEFNEAVRTKDRVTLERLLADDVSWVARGDRLNKAQLIADVVSENLHFKSLAHDNVVVKIFGTTAVITGHSTSILEYKGKSFSAPRLFTSVYMNLNGRWQMVAHQVSDLDPQKEK